MQVTVSFKIEPISLSFGEIMNREIKKMGMRRHNELLRLLMAISKIKAKKGSTH